MKFRSDIAWLGIFLPALMFYLLQLHSFLEFKKKIGSIERLENEMDHIVPKDAEIEVLFDGMKWSEGPLYVRDESTGHGYILFSDTANNVIWRWEEGGGPFTIGSSLFLSKSGCYEKSNDECSSLAQPGSNGMGIDPKTKLLILCEQGERRITRLEKNGKRTVLVSHYQGKRLNSPNDLTFASNGDIYFTDPSYGFNEKENDPARELNFNGVFRVPSKLLSNSTVAEPELLLSNLSRPNGIAFSPDYSSLYISNSDQNAPIMMKYDVDDEWNLSNGQIFFDFRQIQRQGRIGNPDGIEISDNGYFFIAGLGGVLILSPNGKHIGTIMTNRKTGNIVIGEDGYLYITASDLLCRVPTKIKPIKTVLIEY